MKRSSWLVIMVVVVLFGACGLEASSPFGDDAANRESISAPFGITHGPYVQQVTGTSATIIWCTDYRYSVPTLYWGTDSTGLHALSPVTDGLLDVNVDMHKVTLHDLQPGTTYYYKVSNKKISSWTYRVVTYSAIIESDIRQFTTLDELQNETSFMVVNDLYGDKTAMDSLLARRIADKIDFIFLNGNMLASIIDQESIFTGLVDPCCRLFCDRLPFYLVRGVLECRGVYSRELPRYLGGDDYSFYYSFSQGPVRFIVLDAGEEDRDSAPCYAALNVFESYRAQQKEWLEKEVQSEEFLRADYRVVLCHVPIYGGQNHFAEQDIRNQWGDVLNQAPIDLFIAGNSDRYARISPTSPQNQYPIVIGAGAGLGLATAIRVDATRDNLCVAAFQKDGTIIDRFDLKNTHVEQATNSLPTEIALRHNYPNPFNSSTCLSYTVPQKCHVKLKVFNSIGQEVMSLLDSVINAGTYSMIFDPRDLSTGVYYLMLATDAAVQSKKMVYLR